jgi:type I restriction enzyme S subunit
MSDDKHSQFSIPHSPLIPTGYKQTEVGVIPEAWEVKAFESVAHIERGKFTARPRNDPKYYGGDIPFIQTGDVTNSSDEITTFSQTFNQEGLKVSKLFPRGTLFFTIAANIGDVGFAAFDTACPDSLVAITPSNRVHKRWLAHELRRRKKSFENLATHNAQLNINLEKLRPYLLPVPPLSEQEAIAEALSDADALIESLEQLIAKKRQIKQGAMQELLTGKRRLPGCTTKPGYTQTEVGVIPEDWEVTTVGEISDVKTGPFGSALHEKDYVNNGTPIITVEHLSESGVHHTNLPMVSNADKVRLKAYSLRYGGIVFSRVGSVDRNALIKVAEDGWLFSGRLLRVRVKGRDTDEPYLSYHFHSEPFKQRVRDVAVGQTMASSNTQILMGVKIILPPTRAEHTAIATILSDMDDEIVALEEKLAKDRQLKQGMMQELLIGRTRLIEKGKRKIENDLG